MKKMFYTQKVADKKIIHHQRSRLQRNGLSCKKGSWADWQPLKCCQMCGIVTTVRIENEELELRQGDLFFNKQQKLHT